MKLLFFVFNIIDRFKRKRKRKPDHLLPKAAHVFFLNPDYNAIPASQPLPFPRKNIVSTSVSGIIILGLVSACAAITPIAFLQSVLVDRALEQYGVPASATVTSCEKTRSGRPWLTYTYSAKGSNGALLQLEDRAGGNYGQFCADRGRVIAIQYLLENPTVTRIIEPGLAAWGADLGVFILTAIVTTIPLVMLVIAIPQHIHNSWRYRQFVEKGKLLPGKIIAATWPTKRDPAKLSIEYEFLTPDNRTLKGEQSRTRLDMNAERVPAPGAAIRVLYVDDHLHMML
jgi:hypothetical protein